MAADRDMAYLDGKIYWATKDDYGFRVNLLDLSKEVQYPTEEIHPSVSIKGWKYGEYDPSKNAPRITGNKGNGTVTYSYKKADAPDSTYTSNIPQTAGNYILKATVGMTGKYKSAVATVSFSIAYGDQPEAPTGLTVVHTSHAGGYDGEIHGLTKEMEWASKEDFSDARIAYYEEVYALQEGYYYVRFRKTESHPAGKAAILVIGDPLTGDVWIKGDAKYGEELSAVVQGSNNKGKLSYQWMRSGEEIEGVVLDKYTLSKEDIGCNIVCEVSSDFQQGQIYGGTQEVGKADGPAAPEGVSFIPVSAEGASDGKIVGVTTDMEWSMDFEFWSGRPCEGSEISGLDAGVYYVRYAETETALAGSAIEIFLREKSEMYAEMYRLYNPNSGEHFYTASEEERDYLTVVGWNYEGLAWKAPKTSNTPVYRLYNPNAGDHHYTTSAAECDMLVTVGWNYEGIGWYSDDEGGEPWYRLYNPNATQAGAHHYTTNATERDYLVSIGWNDEGIGWYGGK